jgi:hypothetical protein
MGQLIEGSIAFGPVLERIKVNIHSTIIFLFILIDKNSE